MIMKTRVYSQLKTATMGFLEKIAIKTKCGKVRKEENKNQESIT